eukprot:s3195_g7.t1
MATIGEESGAGVSDRDAYAIRRLAISSMIQATADTKARIAEASKTRRSGEMLELKLGDLVELYRKPVTKDAVGWHGPAEVVNLTSLQDGLLHVKWQGRVLAVRIQDVRTAMVYFSFLMNPSGPIKTFKAEVENQTATVLRLGWMRQGQNGVECQGNRSHSNLLVAGLYLSAVCMNLQGVIGFRRGVNAQNLLAVSFDDTLLLWWNVHDSSFSQWYHCFLPGNQLLNVPRITGDPNAAIVQFLMVDMTEVMSLRQVAPDVAHLGGSHEPDMANTNDKTDEVLRTRGPKPLADGPKHVSSESPVDNAAETSPTANDDSTVAVIERTNNILDRDEALLNVDKCREAMVLELMRWVKHGAWKRGKITDATNVLKSKWVLKWKDVQDGQAKSRKIKARLVAQGVLDKQSTDTYAGTSHVGVKRLLITVAVQRQWFLWSADISEAFLRGLTFKELHEEGGELREVPRTMILRVKFW